MAMSTDTTRNSDAATVHTTTPARERNERAERDLSPIRLVAGYGVVVAVVPYLVLKVLWVAGVMVGVPESSPAYAGWEAQNIVTGLLDLAAVAVAMMLTHRWGMRVPSWLVIVPAWIGIGLLVPAVLLVGVGFAFSLATTGQLVSLDGGLVENWTYVVVGSSFAIQGILLTTSFVLYARVRWKGALADRRRGVTLPLQRVLGVTGATLATGVGAVRLAQAALAPDGWYDAPWTFLTRVGELVEGGLAILAAVGILAMTGLLRGWRFRWAVSATWVGTGSLFAYGLGRTVSLAAGAELSELMTPVYRMLNLTGMLAGLVIALTAAFILAERAIRHRDPRSATRACGGRRRRGHRG